MTINELVMLQALPLEIKIAKTQQRIREWVEYWGLDNVYVSYSGGKDSEVLLDICRKLYPNIKAVFSNTGQEFPETIKQVLERKKEGFDIDLVTPKLKFKDVIEKYGYPVVSKEQSLYIEQVRRTKSPKLLKLRLEGGRNGKSFKISEKWKYLIEADFKISNKCCDILKKAPIKKYEKETRRKPIVGTMAHESVLRQRQYLKEGCNSFENSNSISKPIGFWVENDIYEYIQQNNLRISECYTKFKMKRTGCYGCLFGCHLEERTGNNRIVELMDSHPHLYKYLMENLNYKHIMKILGLRTYKLEQQKLFEKY